MSPETPSKVENPAKAPSWELLSYLLIGIFFGVLLIKSEVVSWYRIQEMFRFQDFHMYGVLGSAFATSALVLFLSRRFGLHSLTSKEMKVSPKVWQPGSTHRYWIGGTLFGLGWGLAGTCPGPIYALIGHGASGALVVLVSALLGARVYAAVFHKLPH